MTDRRLIFLIYKEFLQVNKQINILKESRSTGGKNASCRETEKQQ